MVIHRFAVGKCSKCRKIIVMSVMSKKADKAEAYKDLSDWERKGMEAEIMIKDSSELELDWCECGRSE